MKNLTDAQLEEVIGVAYSMSKEGERAVFREYERSESTRIQGSKKLLEACVEANRRGILHDIQKRNPTWKLYALTPMQDLISVLECQIGWVGQRGFEHDKRLVTCLEELIGFRRMFRRQELTGEDEAREAATYETNLFDDGKPWPPDPREAFLAGLRRGFGLRGEENSTKPITNQERPRLGVAGAGA